MYQLSYDSPSRLHFIGIGGISMSGLAEILIGKGFRISGSDRVPSPLTEHLSALGADISYPQKAENLPDRLDAVVYTAAVHPDNPEYAAAKERGLPMLSRAELLGRMMALYPVSVGIAGTHGKTTTTSMLSSILLAADTDPTISVGGILPAIGSNVRSGRGDVFLTEACEYTNSYHEFHPLYSVILNIEAEHLDFFSGLEDVRRSFARYAKNTLPGGKLLLGEGIPRPEEIADGLSCTVERFGLSAGCDLSAADITFDETGCASFTFVSQGSALGRVRLRVPGLHNVTNALAALGVALSAGIPFGTAASGLSDFSGVNRRFQYKGTFQGARIVDDYAHHPTEIAATLEAAGRVSHDRLILVFQPHTYSRTKALMDDFAEVLSRADVLVLADIYAAREEDIYGVSSSDLAEAVQKKGTEVHYLPGFSDIEKFLSEICVPGDLLITMGAGSIVSLSDSLAER